MIAKIHSQKAFHRNRKLINKSSVVCLRFCIVDAVFASLFFAKGGLAFCMYIDVRRRRSETSPSDARKSPKKIEEFLELQFQT